MYYFYMAGLSPINAKQQEKLSYITLLTLTYIKDLYHTVIWKAMNKPK